MEKYSGFNDKLFGINPFLPPKYIKITFGIFLKAMLRIPLFILYTINYRAIKWLIKIDHIGEKLPKYLIYSNKASCFDKSIIRYLYDIDSFSENGAMTRVVFPEGVRTNNRGLLRYTGEKCDYVIGLKYTNECIMMSYFDDWKEKLKWLIRFLGSNNKVRVVCMKGSDLGKATGLPQLSLDKIDYCKFLKQFNKKL